jgi:hypothetical protein
MYSDEKSQLVWFASSQWIKPAENLGQTATSVMVQPESSKINRKVAKVTWKSKAQSGSSNKICNDTVRVQWQGNTPDGGVKHTKKEKQRKELAGPQLQQSPGFFWETRRLTHPGAPK